MASMNAFTKPQCVLAQTALVLLLLPVTPAADSAGWPATHDLGDGTAWSAGNHRYVITVTNIPAEDRGMASVTVPWRRRDSDPASIDAFVVDSRSHLKVPNCTRAFSSKDNGTFIFKAISGPSEYHVYYMPFTTCEYSGGSCSFGADSEYVRYGITSRCVEAQQHSQYSLSTEYNTRYEARTFFDEFGSLAHPSTAEELNQFHNTARGSVKSPIVLIPEDRSRPIKLLDAVPSEWSMLNGTALANPLFQGVAQQGEHYTFQIAAVRIAQKGIVNIQQVKFSSLNGENGQGTIDASNLVCMNMEGSDFWGKPYTPSTNLSLTANTSVVPLWISLFVPVDVASGTYLGRVDVAYSSASNATVLISSVSLEIEIHAGVLADGGDSDQWRGTRLTWLNSKLAVSGDEVPPPYIPIKTAQTSSGGLSMVMLDKHISIGKTGFPESILVGTNANTSTGNTANAVTVETLAAPIGLTVNGEPLSESSLKFLGSDNMTDRWLSTSKAGSGGTVIVNASTDCTGYSDFIVIITPESQVKSLSVELTIPSSPKNAIMAMGLGVVGGYLADMPPAVKRGTPEWLVLDFGKVVQADAIAVYTSGDGIHDPQAMRLESGKSSKGPWEPVVAFTGAKGVADMQSFKFGDQMTASSRYWRWVIINNYPSENCLPATSCQVWVGEVQLHDAISKTWINNTNATAKAKVVSSSGYCEQMFDWKAVDGILTFDEATETGWDGAYAPLPSLYAESNNSLAVDWGWDGVNGNNAVWTGSSAGGTRLFLKGSEPEWQAAVPFDSAQTPSIANLTWNNNGLGGIHLHYNGSTVAYTGPVPLSGNQPLELRFSLMVTPVRPLDLPKHFQERYAQLGGPANYSFIASQGATVVNMHQGNAINPWINYPYETNELMKDASEQCHQHGLKFKIYNTMRELSNRCREIWAMRAFDETYVRPGTDDEVASAADWLKEHLKNRFIKAWSNPVDNVYPGSTVGDSTPRVTNWVDHAHEQDAAIKVKALSRWNNYYVEGLRQMIEDFDYDGIYLDEIAYDRITMLRAKKVLGSDRLIDHHSDKGGFTPSPATNYLELYPFIDSLWYGEGFNYEAARPAYWLTEMSGIPHGLNADLLRYSGMVPEHFKGMLFASANRWQSAVNGAVPGADDIFDPRSVWALWDTFQINESVMYGFWLDRERGEGTVPITTNNSDVLVTSFVRKGESVLIALASFLKTDVRINLKINFDMLGISPASSKLIAPRLPPMQNATSFLVNATIPVTAGQGWMLLLEHSVE